MFIEVTTDEDIKEIININHIIRVCAKNKWGDDRTTITVDVEDLYSNSPYGPGFGSLEVEETYEQVKKKITNAEKRIKEAMVSRFDLIDMEE